MATNTLAFSRENADIGTVTDRANRWARLGYVWRFDFGYRATLATAADYWFYAFTTPAASVGTCYYFLSVLEKSGGEIVAELLEGPTVATGLTAKAPVNLDRTVAWDVPFATATIDSYISSSGKTCINGTVLGTALLTGSAAGASSAPGAASSGSSPFRLAPATLYALKLTAKGAATFAGHFNVAVVKE